MTLPNRTAGNNPERAAPFRRRVLWNWSVALTALSVVFLMYRCGSVLVQGRKLARAAVEHFHEQLNSEQYEAIYREADEGFRTAQSHDESIHFLEAVHKKLGLTEQENQINLRADTNTRGTFLTAWYRTTFAHGGANETFTWVKRRGVLKLCAYHVESIGLVLDREKPGAESPHSSNCEGPHSESIKSRPAPSN